MNLTAKPSVAVWLGQKPANPQFSFTGDGELRRLLDSPALYDRILIDVSRMRPGPYRFEWLRELSPYSRASLAEAILHLLLQGKDVTLYMGGLHEEELSRYLDLFSRRQARDEIIRTLGDLRTWAGHRRVSFAVDALGGGSVEFSREVRSLFAHTLADLGHRTIVEAFAFPGRSISAFPSVSTAAFLRRFAHPTGYEGGAHGVLMTNSEGRDLVPGWRREGRAIYLGSPDIAPDRPLPEWWGGSDQQGQQEAA